MEQLSNNASSTLAGVINSSTTTVVVTDASSFPASGTFRLLCEDELMVCIARSGDTLTVQRGQEGTRAVAHIGSTPIFCVLTASGLAAYVAQYVDALNAQIESLAVVASTGSFNDLLDKPSLGTAAALDVGTTAHHVVQLDGSAKLPAVDGSQLTGIVQTVTANRALASDGSGHVAASSVTAAELGYLAGTSSSVQTQLNAKVATSSLSPVATSGHFNDLTTKPRYVALFGGQVIQVG